MAVPSMTGWDAALAFNLQRRAKPRHSELPHLLDRRAADP